MHRTEGTLGAQVALAASRAGQPSRRMRRIRCRMGSPLSAPARCPTGMRPASHPTLPATWRCDSQMPCFLLLLLGEPHPPLPSCKHCGSHCFLALTRLTTACGMTGIDLHELRSIPVESLPLLLFILWQGEGGLPCRQRFLCLAMPSSCCACTGRAAHELLTMTVHSKRWVMPRKLRMHRTWVDAAWGLRCACCAPGAGDAGEGGDAPQHPHRHHGRAPGPRGRAQQRAPAAPRQALGALRPAGRLLRLPHHPPRRLGRYVACSSVWHCCPCSSAFLAHHIDACC